MHAAWFIPLRLPHNDILSLFAWASRVWLDRVSIYYLSPYAILVSKTPLHFHQLDFQFHRYDEITGWIERKGEKNAVAKCRASFISSTQDIHAHKANLRQLTTGKHLLFNPVMFPPILNYEILVLLWIRSDSAISLSYCIKLSSVWLLKIMLIFIVLSIMRDRSHNPFPLARI